MAFTGLASRAIAAAEDLAQRLAALLGDEPRPAQEHADTPPTLPPAGCQEFHDCAYYAIRLAMRRTWVNRRNETFTFVDASTVRRRMSVDFTLPPSSVLMPGQMALVPLMLLTKGDLRNLDVRDEAGGAVPVLNLRQHEEAAVDGLCEILLRLVDTLPAGHHEQLVDRGALQAIIRSRPGRREPSLIGEYVRDGGRLDRQLKYSTETRSQIVSLLALLETSFMLLVPVAYWPGQRLVRKLSYDAEIRPQGVTRASRAYTRANRVLSSLGLAGRVEFFSSLAIGLADSYHAEAVPPADTYFAEASLSVRREGQEVDDAPITDDHEFRPHLRAQPTRRLDEGKLQLTIHARREQLVLPLAFSSVLITIVLGFLPRHAYTVDGQTLAALLLVPFALSAFYIRSQENSYVTRMLRAVRLVAVVPLLAAVSAIGLLALGTVPPDSSAPLSARTLDQIRMPFLLAVGPTILLLVATIAPAIGNCTRPYFRRKEERARQAAQRHSERALRGLGEPAERSLAARVKALTATLVILLVTGSLGYGFWLGVSKWWTCVVPAAPPSMLDDNEFADPTPVPGLRPGTDGREPRRRDLAARGARPRADRRG